MFYDFEDGSFIPFNLPNFFEILSSGELDKTASVTLNYFKEFQVILQCCSLQVVM